MFAEALGGTGDLPPRELWEAVAEHRFFFNPIRYTSMGLAVCPRRPGGAWPMPPGLDATGPWLRR